MSGGMYLEKAVADSTCYDVDPNPDVPLSHYSRAQMGVQMLFWFDVRVDSDRRWGVGSSHAETSPANAELTGKTFYGGAG